MSIIPPSIPDITPNSGVTPMGDQSPDKTKNAVPATGTAASTDAAGASIIKPDDKTTEEISLVTPGAAAALKAEGAQAKGLADGVPVHPVQEIIGSYLTRLDRFRLQNANDAMPAEDIARSEISRFTAGRPIGAEYNAMVKLWTKQNVPVEEQLERISTINDYVFGPEDWEDRLGARIVGDIPAFPENFWDFISGNLKDKHVVTFVPRAVVLNKEQKNISLTVLDELVRHPRNRNAIGVNIEISENQMLPQPTNHWVLMTRECIPDSIGNIDLEVAQQLYKEFNANHPSFRVSVMDATASVLLHFVKTGERLLERAPTICMDGFLYVGGYKDNLLQVVSILFDANGDVDWHGSGLCLGRVYF